MAHQDHILFMTAESLKHGLAMKLMPGQLLSSKHLALWRKVDHWSEQQLKIASSHEDSGLFVLLVCGLVLLSGGTWVEGAETATGCATPVEEGGTPDVGCSFESKYYKSCSESLFATQCLMHVAYLVLTSSLLAFASFFPAALFYDNLFSYFCLF